MIVYKCDVCKKEFDKRIGNLTRIHPLYGDYELCSDCFSDFHENAVKPAKEKINKLTLEFIEKHKQQMIKKQEEFYRKHKYTDQQIKEKVKEPENIRPVVPSENRIRVDFFLTWLESKEKTNSKKDKEKVKNKNPEPVTEEINNTENPAVENSENNSGQS